MKLQTNKDGSVEVRELDCPIEFINKSGDVLKVRVYDKFFILDYGECQYKLEKGKVPQMLIGTERIDEYE
jgi:hypothetical protein